jgi:hypothetical protein
MIVWLVYPLTTIVPNYSAFTKRNHLKRLEKHALPLFEVAPVLVCSDHGASFIVNAEHGVV